MAFRGSTTNQDFLTDASVSMTSEENPFAHDAANQEKLIKFHSGFYGKSFIVPNQAYALCFLKKFSNERRHYCSAH